MPVPEPLNIHKSMHPTEWAFPILAVMFFVICNTENLFFYPSVTHAEKNFAF